MDPFFGKIVVFRPNPRILGSGWTRRSDFGNSLNPVNSPNSPNYTLDLIPDSIYYHPAPPIRKNMKNKWILAIPALGVFMFICAGAYVYATPYITLWNMRSAFVNKDAKAFCSYIDFPVFRENFKAELNAKMMSEMTKNKELQDNPFAGLGLMMAPAIINNMVDAFVSPAAIERLMNEPTPSGEDAGKPSSPFKGFGENSDMDVSTGYESFSEFTVDTVSKTNPAQGVKIVLERRGLFSWQLVNIKLK